MVVEPGRDEQQAAEDARSIGEAVREAWGQALVAVSDTGEEVQRFLGRMQGWVEVGPDEARRLALELTEKLRRERDDLEGRVETAVRRAIGSVRLPTREDVAALDARLDRIEERIDKLLAERR